MAIGANIKEAMEFASKCSSITVTRKGAIIALPHKEDLLQPPTLIFIPRCGLL